MSTHPLAQYFELTVCGTRWHDLPLFEVDSATEKPTGSLHFVCEIPKWTRKKFELATKEAHNPIKQDEKKGEVSCPQLALCRCKTHSP